LVDFSIVLPIVLILGVQAHGAPLENWLAIPVGVALLLAVTFGVGVWLAALNARYRDVMLALPIVLQIGFYLTPVVFSASIVLRVVTEQWLPVLAFVNPMLGVVELFRWSTLGTDPPDPIALLMSSLAATILVGTGGVFFSRTERTVVDRI
jgi:lipopolysaccharide transport system permease protein